MITLYVGSDNLIRVVNLKDLSGGDDAPDSPVTTATISAQIKDSSGADIGPAISLSFVAGTNGDYEGIADDTLSLVANSGYTIEVTVDDGLGRHAFWTAQARAVTRAI